MIEPGEVYEYNIDIGATSILLRPGSRVRLEISSSNFPRFDRNTNTGEPIGRNTRTQTALNTVHHSADCPSHVVLPIVG